MIGNCINGDFMKRTYGFASRDGYIVEVEASTPESAYNLAKRQAQTFNKQITPRYVTYGRTGFADANKWKVVRKISNKQDAVFIYDARGNLVLYPFVHNVLCDILNPL